MLMATKHCLRFFYFCQGTYGLQARSSHVARVAHAPPLRGPFFFFFFADAFLDCAGHEYKNTDEEKRAFWPALYV